uniref:Trypsin Inhibitor like cysteine rich domain protein n=1 Tax=Heterorhabditis bacteriophora TaxID=37862 RepID=A0A1I7X5E9_HETBA
MHREQGYPTVDLACDSEIIVNCQESVNGDGAQCLPVNDCSSIKCKPGYNCMIDPSTNNAACVLLFGFSRFEKSRVFPGIRTIGVPGILYEFQGEYDAEEMVFWELIKQQSQDDCMIWGKFRSSESEKDHLPDKEVGRSITTWQPEQRFRDKARKNISMIELHFIWLLFILFYNETLSGCGNICEGKCEQVGKGPVACPEICLPPACACKEGFYRQATGECVDIRDCTLTCGPNEEGNPCGNLCEPTCQNAISNEPVICPAICGPPACVCQPNFYRKNKVCVPKSQCLDSCGKNEQINRCGSRCEETCENAFGLIKPCPHICDPPACVCKPNFYRKDGKCVPRDQCTLKCEEGEILAECGNICEPKCKDIGKPPRPCVLICAPRACTCVNGLYRDNKGKCVSKDKCSSATPPNQGYQAKIGLASLKAVVQPNPCGRS